MQYHEFMRRLANLSQHLGTHIEQAFLRWSGDGKRVAVYLTDLGWYDGDPATVIADMEHEAWARAKARVA